MLFIYLFVREREREPESWGGTEGEGKGGETTLQPDSTLNVEPHAGLGLVTLNCDLRSQPRDHDREVVT